MQKCFGVTIKDKVQDIGFRGFIENIARSNYLEGIVFNDKDGSVKLVIRGDNSVVDDFFDEIQIKGNKRGIILEIKEKKELELDIPLPPIFSKVGMNSKVLSTDDEEDIGRKLDRGNELLGKLVEGQNKLVEGQNKLVEGQSSILDILEKIENKL